MLGRFFRVKQKKLEKQKHLKERLDFVMTQSDKRSSNVSSLNENLGNDSSSASDRRFSHELFK